MVYQPSLPILNLLLKSPTSMHTCSMTARDAASRHAGELRTNGGHFGGGDRCLNVFLGALTPLPARQLSTQLKCDEDSQGDRPRTEITVPAPTSR